MYVSLYELIPFSTSPGAQIFIRLKFTSDRPSRLVSLRFPSDCGSFEIVSIRKLILWLLDDLLQNLLQNNLGHVLSVYRYRCLKFTDV